MGSSVFEKYKEFISSLDDSEKRIFEDLIISFMAEIVNLLNNDKYKDMIGEIIVSILADMGYHDS